MNLALGKLWPQLRPSQRSGQFHFGTLGFFPRSAKPQPQHQTMMTKTMLVPVALLAIGQGCLLASAFSGISSSHRTVTRHTKSGHLQSKPRTQLFATEVESPPTTKSQNKYDNLIQWFLSSNEKSYISPNIAIQQSARGKASGYGMFAIKDVEEGELLLRIPRSCCVTLDDALTDPECGPAFKAVMDKAGPGSDTVILAGYLAKEYLLLKEYDTRLAAGMKDDDNSEMRRLSKIKFAPYLRTLPWNRGVNAQEHVLFWEDEDVDALLKGSLAYDDAIETRNSVSAYSSTPCLL